MSKLTETSVQKLTDKQLREIKLDTSNENLIINEILRRNETANKSRSNQNIFDYTDIAKDKQKAHRTKVRSQINAVCYLILKSKVGNDKPTLIANCKKFVELYKKNYLLNDFSIDSFRRQNSDSDKLMLLENCLPTIKLFVAGKIK